MRFLMIDRICELEKGKSARGIKNISWDGDFLEEIIPGLPVVSSFIIAEAVGQLLSWIIVEAKDFTVKPVITVVDSYICNGHIQPGDQLEVMGSVESMSEEGALVHGKILLRGKPVIEINHAVCYAYPLSELDPPERARLQFKHLYVPGCPLPQTAQHPASLMREEVPLYKRPWFDRIIDEGQPARLVAIKNVTATEDYFNDHFPRKPILPGVVIMEAQHSLARELVLRQLAERGLTDSFPVLCRAEKVKFRLFIQPGDQMALEATVKSFSDGQCSIATRVTVGGKNAASVLLHFELPDRASYMHKYILGR